MLGAPSPVAYHLKKRWLSLAAVWLFVICLLSGTAFSYQNSGGILHRLNAALGLGLDYRLLDTANLILRKSAHVSIYTILTGLTLLASGPHWRRLLPRIALLGLCCASLDELHQLFEAERGASVFDVLWDFSGCLFAMVLFSCYRLYWCRETQPPRA